MKTGRDPNVRAIRLSEDVLTKIDAYAEGKGMSRSEAIRLLMDVYVEKKFKPRVRRSQRMVRVMISCEPERQRRFMEAAERGGDTASQAMSRLMELNR